MSLPVIKKMLIKRLSQMEQRNESLLHQRYNFAPKVTECHDCHAFKAACQQQ